MSITTTTLNPLLLALQAQVMTFLTLPAECVPLWARDNERDEAHIQADQYVRIRYADEYPDENSVTGMGRINTILRCDVACVLWTRLALDDVNADTIWATDAVLGHNVARASLWDALIIFQPLDANNNWLVTEPIKPRKGGKPDKREPKEPGWGRSSIEFRMSYIAALTQSYQ